MANVLLCDICRKEIVSKGGTITPEPLFGWSDSAAKYDLCLRHYNGMKDVMKQYLKFEQGFAATWPERSKYT